MPKKEGREDSGLASGIGNSRLYFGGLLVYAQRKHEQGVICVAFRRDGRLRLWNSCGRVALFWIP